MRTQFLVESLLLATLGGVTGVLTGSLVTAAYAWSRDWPAVIPAWALAGGVLATMLVGAVAGLYPAMRAAALPPTEALTH